MPTTRIMLLGAGGQVGRSLQWLFDKGSLPKGWELLCFDRARLDVTNPSNLRDAVQASEPAIIINAAALTNVDKAEKDSFAAAKVNFHAVANLAAQASALDVPVLHLSTDYVFDGRQTAPYQPDDLMNPLNEYGASKMMGEESLRHGMPWHVILRTSLIFSAFCDNILPRTLEAIETQDELRFAANRTSCPTPALDVARTLVSIAEQILAGKVDGFGTFHYCGAPPCSRLAFAQAVMEAYAPFTQRNPAILPALDAALRDGTPRPASSVLDCAKIKDVYNISQPSWHEGLAVGLRLLLENRAKQGDGASRRLEQEKT